MTRYRKPIVLALLFGLPGMLYYLFCGYEGFAGFSETALLILLIEYGWEKGGGTFEKSRTDGLIIAGIILVYALTGGILASAIAVQDAVFQATLVTVPLWKCLAELPALLSEYHLWSRLFGCLGMGLIGAGAYGYVTVSCYGKSKR